jgi:hypothetical protein
MADKQRGIRIVRITVAKAMCLIALTAVIFNWPPLILAALPIILTIGYGVLGNVSATGASVLAALSLALCAAVGVLWMRSYDVSDGLILRLRGGWGLVRSSRGYVVVGLDSTPGLVVPPGFNRLEYRCRDASLPYLGDRPNVSPGILLGPEDDDRASGWSWAGFVWFEVWNHRLGTDRASGVIPFWYIMILTVASPLVWAAMRWRSGGRARGTVPRPSAKEADAYP